MLIRRSRVLAHVGIPLELHMSIREDVVRTLVVWMNGTVIGSLDRHGGAIVVEHAILYHPEVGVGHRPLQRTVGVIASREATFCRVRRCHLRQDGGAVAWVRAHVAAFSKHRSRAHRTLHEHDGVRGVGEASQQSTLRTAPSPALATGVLSAQEVRTTSCCGTCTFRIDGVGVDVALVDAIGQRTPSTLTTDSGDERVSGGQVNTPRLPLAMGLPLASYTAARPDFT